MRNLSKLFSDRVERALEKHGDIGELVKKAEISRPTLARWRAGMRSPDLDQVERVAAALNMKPVALLTPEDQPWTRIPSDLLDMIADAQPEALNAVRSILMGFALQREASEPAKGLEKPSKGNKKG